MTTTNQKSSQSEQPKRPEQPEFTVVSLSKTDFFDLKSDILRLWSQLSDVGDVQKTQSDKSNLLYRENVEALFETGAKTIVMAVVRAAQTEQEMKINADGPTVCAIGTVFFEFKITHDGCVVAHIEDIVVDAAYRGHGLGRLLIQALCSAAHQEEKCRKISLNCSKANVPFYERCNVGLAENAEVRMIKYL